MSTIHRSRTAVAAFAAMLMIALSASNAVHAEDQLLPAEEQVLAPDAMPGPSVTTQVPGDVRWAPASTIAPTTSVATSRVQAAQHALLSPDLGSLQEEALRAVVATAMSWDATSGYRSVEASRAAASALYAPGAGPTWDDTSGYGAVEASRAEPDVFVAPATGTTAAASGLSSAALNRVTSAQHALDAGNLGSMQEEALFAVVATGLSWDTTSGYGALEASRATIGHPVARATVEMNPDYLLAALASGQRSESAHLATVSLPGDAGSATSDDRIANALFGAQSSHNGAVAAGRMTIEDPAASTTAETTRVAVAHQALLAGDLGSLQEEALAAVVAASSIEDDASVDDALASTRTALLAQFRAVELASSRSLGAARQLQSCAVEG